MLNRRAATLRSPALGAGGSSRPNPLRFRGTNIDRGGAEGLLTPISAGRPASSARSE